MAKGFEYLLDYPSEGQHRGGGAVFGEKGNAALGVVGHGVFFFGRVVIVLGRKIEVIRGRPWIW